ncbi:MAG: hypothetical protein JNM68_02040 [Dinghuibacter sp.]|nr:hypothetical protein [Dinghuibacter sp.]
MKMKLIVAMLVLPLFSTAQEYLGPMLSGNTLVLQNRTGNVILEGKKGVEGTPWLSDEWAVGKISMDNGQVFDSLMLKFNMEHNVLLFLQNGSPYECANNVRDFTVTYSGVDAMETVQYRKNFPNINNHTTNTFYQLLADGPRLQLLCYRAKRYAETLVPNAAPRKHYTEIADYYIYDSKTKTIQLIKPKKSSLVEALPELEQQINTLCSDNGWKLKSWDEMKLLVMALRP